MSAREPIFHTYHLPAEAVRRVEPYQEYGRRWLRVDLLGGDTVMVEEDVVRWLAARLARARSEAHADAGRRK